MLKKYSPYTCPLPPKILLEQLSNLFSKIINRPSRIMHRQNSSYAYKTFTRETLIGQGVKAYRNIYLIIKD